MPYVDRTKNYTYSDNFKYIIDDNLDEIKMLFESNIIKYLLFQFSKNGFDSVDIIKLVNKKILNNIKTEQDLYLLYNINDEELTHIKLLLGLGNNSDKNINNEKQKIIKDGRKQYYLIEDKLYKVKKDKSQGELFGTYIDGKIEETIKKPSKEDNDELIDESIIKVKKKKAIKKPSKEDNDESIIKVKKKKSIVKKS